MTARILLINGSLAGGQGNSATVAAVLRRCLEPRCGVDVLTLAECEDPDIWETQLRQHDGFVFLTGTYWDSWSSPLQRFLEELTALEATEVWLGKPAAVLVTMHSVGGKAVVSRLQGVLNTLGLMIPPLTGWAYSACQHTLVEVAEQRLDELDEPEGEHPFPVLDDTWQLDDLETVAHNLLEAVAGTRAWRAWPVDRQGFERRWLEP